MVVGGRGRGASEAVVFFSPGKARAKRGVVGSKRVAARELCCVAFKWKWARLPPIQGGVLGCCFLLSRPFDAVMSTRTLVSAVSKLGVFRCWVTHTACHCLGSMILAAMSGVISMMRVCSTMNYMEEDACCECELALWQ